MDVTVLTFHLLSLPADLANTYLLYKLVAAKRKRLFWGIMLVQILVVRTLRIVVGDWIAPIGVPIVVVTALVQGEGDMLRKALLLGAYALLSLVTEVSACAVWFAITGTFDQSAAIGGINLDTYVTTQMAVISSLLVVSWAAGPFARRFRNKEPLSRVKRAEVALVPFALGQMLATYANITLRYWAPVEGARYLLPEILMMALFLAADVALLGDVRAYECRSENEMRANLLTRVADSFMRHYRDIEASIIRTGKLRHDLRNQLQVADVLAAEDKGEEAAALLADLSSLLSEDEGDLLVSLLMSRDLAASGGQATKGEDTPAPDSDGNRMLHRMTGTVLFVASQVVAVVVFALHVPIFTISRWPLYVAVAALAVWLLSDFFLFGLLRRAREVDISQERVRVAKEFLDARRQMGLHLEREVREAEELRLQMLSHVRELEGLLAEGRIDEFHEGAVGEKGLPLGSPRYCENSVADALTRVKADAAERLGVRFDAEFDIPEDLALPPLELCTILSNIYDNAIKGANAAPEGRRWVHVGAKVAAGYLIVVCKNGCAEGAFAPKRDGAPGAVGLQAGRPGVQGHGWGLRILDEVASRLDGTLETSVEDGIFVTRVTARAQLYALQRARG